MTHTHSQSVPDSLRPAYAAIVALLDPFCAQNLNEEYAQLSRELAAALARKRPSPRASGKPEIWACGIVYALGTVNFLFDASQTPHMRADALCAAFGVNQSSGANKGRLIRELFGTFQFDPNWCLPSLIDQNPMVWMLEVNGLFAGVRTMPRDVQEIAFQKGLIPLAPVERDVTLTDISFSQSPALGGVLFTRLLELPEFTMTGGAALAFQGALESEVVRLWARILPGARYRQIFGLYRRSGIELAYASVDDGEPLDQADDEAGGESLGFVV